MSKSTLTAQSLIYYTEIERLLIYRLWAEFKSPAVVQTKFNEEMKKEISVAVISNMCRRPEAMIYINKFRDEFLMKVKEVPIANKRVRMEELQKTIDENADLRIRVDLDKPDGRQELSMIQRRNNETLCVAREEIEGKALVMQQFNFSQYSGMTDEELQKRKDELIEKAVKARSAEMGQIVTQDAGQIVTQDTVQTVKVIDDNK